MARKVLKRTDSKVAIRARRRRRIRKDLAGSAQRPRLTVTKTNKLIVAQLIDDDNGNTLLRLQTPKGKTANIDLAKEVGKQLAAQAQAKGISQCVFDRAGNLYHGRVAAVATGAREGGLKF